MTKALISVAAALLLAVLPAKAQDDELVYRLELGAGAGAGFGFYDVKAKTGLAGSLIARFPLNPRMAVKTQLGYATVKGSAADVADFYPASPYQSGTERLGYSVSSGLYSLSALYELHFLPYGYVAGYQGYKRVTPFIQMGLSLSYAAAGKAVAFGVPIGVGVKYKAGPRLNLGLDWITHFTFSDKIDGLSAPHGIKTSGFRGKDHFSTLQLTLTYDLNPRCPTCNRDL